MKLNKHIFFEYLIQKMAETSSTSTIEFDGIIPAIIVARELLDYATDNVNIVWGKLSDSILNNDLFVEGIEEALAREVKFSVVSQRETSCPTEMELLLYSARMPLSGMKGLVRADCNFISCDNTAYLDWSRLKGIGNVCFNDPLTASSKQIKYGEITR
jgi:hypothetical protein